MTRRRAGKRCRKKEINDPAMGTTGMKCWKMHKFITAEAAAQENETTEALI